MSLLTHPAQPGLFKAHCRLVEKMTAQQMTPAQYASATDAGVTSRWDTKAKAEVWLVQCDVTFEDAAVYERHMAEQHAQRPAIWDSPQLTAAAAERHVRAYQPRTAAVEPFWKPPRLAAEGRSFDPRGLDVGAEVKWEDNRCVAPRTGQVWSLAPRAKSVWVVPDEPLTETHPDGGRIRTEQAVMLTEYRSGTLEPVVWETYWSAWSAAA